MACIAKRRDRYVLDYYDNQGERVRKALKKGTTLKKAKEKLREIEDQLTKGIYISETKIPTFPEVAKEWLKHKKPNIRSSTWSVYEGHTLNHFSEFEDLKTNRITIAMIEKWITDRQAKEMPIGTIRKVLVSGGLFGLKWSDMDWENSQVHIQRTFNNQEAASRLENTVFNATGHKMVTTE